MTRQQTQAEANAYWENVEFKKWVVTFTAGSSRSRRTAESLVTSRTSTGARKAAISHQQIERGNDWVTSAMSTVRLATAQDLGCIAATEEPVATNQPIAVEGWTITKDNESWTVVSPSGQKRRWFEKTTAHDDSPFMCAFLNALNASRAQPDVEPVSVPDGWVLVPVEPSSEMLDAAARASMQHLLDCIHDPAKVDQLGSAENIRKTHASRYRSMISAVGRGSAPTGQGASQ